MAQNKYSNDGIDLTTYFMAYQSGTKISTGYSYNDSDLGNLFQPYTLGTKAPATNYYKMVGTTPTDLNEFFQNKNVPLSVINTVDTTAPYVETTYGNYNIITITGSGTMKFTQDKTMTTIVVGGGGGGGGYYAKRATYFDGTYRLKVVGGGGGGGGGSSSYTIFTTPTTTITVTIGTGGNAGTQTYSDYDRTFNATNGGNGGSTSLKIGSNPTNTVNGGIGGICGTNTITNNGGGAGGAGGTNNSMGDTFLSKTGASGNYFTENATSISNNKSNTDMGIIYNQYINKYYGAGGANDGSSFSYEGSGGSGAGADSYTVVNDVYSEGDMYRFVKGHNATSGKNGVIYLYYNK